MQHIGSSGFGYELQLGFSWFSVSQQLVDRKLVDLSTSADGYTIYATPVIGYLFGDDVFRGGKGKSLLVGLGLGGGYLFKHANRSASIDCRRRPSSSFRDDTITGPDAWKSEDRLSDMMI